MVFPLIVFSVGFSALVARGLLKASKALFNKNAHVIYEWMNKGKFVWLNVLGAQGFESRMSTLEAYRILNLSPIAGREKIIKTHRLLIIRNHPDNGGSNFVASKVNEAKDLLLKAYKNNKNGTP